MIKGLRALWITYMSLHYEKHLKKYTWQFNWMALTTTHLPGSSHKRQHLDTEPWPLQLLSATSGTFWYSCIQPQVRDRGVEQLLQCKSWELPFLLSSRRPWLMIKMAAVITASLVVLITVEIRPAMEKVILSGNEARLSHNHSLLIRSICEGVSSLCAT